MAKHWCGKGILEKDRRRGRCGRCGLSVWLPPPRMSQQERRRFMQSRGPEVPQSIIHLLAVCAHCKAEKHDRCENDIHWFCVCYRARHDKNKLKLEGLQAGEDRAILARLKKQKGGTPSKDEEEWEDFV